MYTKVSKLLSLECAGAHLLPSIHLVGMEPLCMEVLVADTLHQLCLLEGAAYSTFSSWLFLPQSHFQLLAALAVSQKSQMVGISCDLYSGLTQVTKHERL